MLLGDSFPWDLLGIKSYCFIVVFLISIVSILLDHWYSTLHILVDVYSILLHCTCFAFEITHLLPLQRDVLFKHGHFLPEKKNEVDLHG